VLLICRVRPYCSMLMPVPVSDRVLFSLTLDFRFMETMASGALVLVDRMATPRPHPLINNKHVVYYGACCAVLCCAVVSCVLCRRMRVDDISNLLISVCL
jgi:hypothetical protein